MTKFTKYFKYFLLTWILLAVACTGIFAQYYPVPPYMLPGKYSMKHILSNVEPADGIKFANGIINMKEADSLKTEADTVSNKNRIKYLVEKGGNHALKIELENYDNDIVIEVFNLLGKQVLEVYKGQPVREMEYIIQSWKLPNGVYICTIHGKNFRLTGKFIVAR